MSKNEITGDRLATKPTTKAYEEGWDRIFSSKEPLCHICGKDLNKVTECAWTSCPALWNESRIDVIGQNGNTGEHY
jgi:hypothetical protein